MIVDRMYLGIGIAAVWVGSLAAVGIWQRGEGKAITEREYMARDVKDLQALNDKLVSVQKALVAAKDAYEKAVSEITTNYQSEIQDVKAQRDRDVAAARNGTLVLRYAADDKAACRGGLPDASPATSGSDGRAQSELPREITADLFGLVDDADEVVKQLTLCQKLLIEDRKLCNRR